MTTDMFPRSPSPTDPEIRALEDLRDQARNAMLHAQARLHAIAPDRYPDPSSPIPTSHAGWTSLPIHESEPRD